MPAEGEDTAVLVGLPVPETPRAGEPEDDEGLDFELVATLCLALALLFPIAAWLGRRPASVSSPP